MNDKQNAEKVIKGYKLEVDPDRITLNDLERLESNKIADLKAGLSAFLIDQDGNLVDAETASEILGTFTLTDVLETVRELRKKIEELSPQLRTEDESDTP